MSSNHLCSNEPQFSCELTIDQVIALCLLGKIERCDGHHDGQKEGELIFHPADDFEIDLTEVGQLIKRRSW